MSDQPLITIGITSYNALRTLPRAIGSALNQTYANIELLIVDDRSTDGSIEYLEDISSKYNNIRLIVHPENTGCAGARNTILSNAQGEFIAFFDDDDESMPERIQAQYDRILSYEQKHKTDLIFCYITRIVRENEDSTTDRQVRAIGYKSPEPSGEMVADYILLHLNDESLSWGQMGIGTSMARSSIFQKIGLFDPDFRRNEEWDLALRAAFKGAHFISVDEPLMIQNITVTADKSHKIGLHYALLLRRKYKNFLIKRHAYLASLCCAFARSHYASLHPWKSRMWTAASILLSPTILLPFHLKRKFGR